MIMKKTLLCSLSMFAAGSLFAADASPKDDVTTAANALGNEKNYSWHTTTDFGANARFRPGPTDGKTEKDGYTTVSMTFNDNTTQLAMQGAKAAIKTPDGDWQSAAVVLQRFGGPNPAMFAARMTQNFKTP